jgi:hypothetical protein
LTTNIMINTLTNVREALSVVLATTCHGPGNGDGEGGRVQDLMTFDCRRHGVGFAPR